MFTFENESRLFYSLIKARFRRNARQWKSDLKATVHRYIYYWLLSEMCIVINFESNRFQFTWRDCVKYWLICYIQRISCKDGIWTHNASETEGFSSVYMDFQVYSDRDFVIHFLRRKLFQFSTQFYKKNGWLNWLIDVCIFYYSKYDYSLIMNE